MYGLFALGGAVNEDIEIVAAFGGNSDKLLIAAVIVNQEDEPEADTGETPEDEETEEETL